MNVIILEMAKFKGYLGSDMCHSVNRRYAETLLSHQAGAGELTHPLETFGQSVALSVQTGHGVPHFTMQLECVYERARKNT